MITWIAEANLAQVLPQLAGANGTAIGSAAELTAFLEGRKSYAPTQEITSSILMGEPACRIRAALLLNALCDTLLDPSVQSSPLFIRETEDGAAMPTFRFEPLNDI
ncbi:hypothetical protein [Salipiger bermudensis]|uniref:hypothetical protein n=1 Tax=Salipiger bermudensis TaxID=344736 RepID=UPI0021BD2445|nr:hypothetical protein [Salipiger bermudensis]